MENLSVPQSSTDIRRGFETIATFAIAVGVKRGNTDLRDRLDAALAKRKADIDRILDEYSVPRAARPQ